MTLILSNDDVDKALNVKDCLTVMEESYRDRPQAAPSTGPLAIPICPMRCPTRPTVLNPSTAASANTGSWPCG